KAALEAIKDAQQHYHPFSDSQTEGLTDEGVKDTIDKREITIADAGALDKIRPGLRCTLVLAQVLFQPLTLPEVWQLELLVSAIRASPDHLQGCDTEGRIAEANGSTQLFDSQAEGCLS